MSEPTGVSVRGLEDGFQGTPLRKFSGVFEGYTEEPATGYDGVRVNLQFSDVEVEQSTEPYNLPTVVLNIGLSKKKKSKWGYIADSIAAIIPEDEDLKDQYGKRFVLVLCDGQEGRPEGKLIWSKDADRAKFPTGEIPMAVWEVLEIAGTSKGDDGKINTSKDKAMKILDGKTLSEFNKLAYADPDIRKDVELQRGITNKSFVAGLVAAGAFEKDMNGVYHKAGISN